MLLFDVHALASVSRVTLVDKTLRLYAAKTLIASCDIRRYKDRFRLPVHILPGNDYIVPGEFVTEYYLLCMETSDYRKNFLLFGSLQGVSYFLRESCRDCADSFNDLSGMITVSRKKSVKPADSRQESLFKKDD